MSTHAYNDDARRMLGSLTYFTTQIEAQQKDRENSEVLVSLTGGGELLCGEKIRGSARKSLTFACGHLDENNII